MKCINCYREIDDGLKFCPKCGFMQPDDRAAYELEHPELAEAMPEDEMLKQVDMLASVPRSAMTRDEFVQFVATDPNCDAIVNVADEGVMTYGLAEPAAVEAWYAKCAELIGDKQGFYPYFVKLLMSHPEKASHLLTSQVAEDMNIVMPQQQAAIGDTAPQQYSELVPPPHPVIPTPPAPPTSPTPPAPPANAGVNPPVPKETTPSVPAPSPAEVPQPSPIEAIQPLESQQTVECPICHQFIPFGTRQCPYCKQLLDWSYTMVESKETPKGKKRKRGALWVVLAIIMALLIGGTGYFIYKSVKSKTHISRNDSDSDSESDSDSRSSGPTGNVRKDAKHYVNELIDLMEDAYITSQDDYDRFNRKYEKINQKYMDYYQDLGENKLNEFNNEVGEYYEDPDVKQRFQRAVDRIEEQSQSLSSY